MPKFIISTLILILILALLAPNFACRAALATDGGQSPSGSPNSVPMPQTPLDSLLKGDSVKDTVQGWMEQAQNQLQEGATKASDAAQQAAKDEISRQANKQIEGAKKGIVSTIKDGVQIVVNKIKEISQSIVNFVKEKLKLYLFKPSTY